MEQPHQYDENELSALLKAAELAAREKLDGLSEPEAAQFSAWLQERAVHAHWQAEQADTAHFSALLAQYHALRQAEAGEWEKFSSAHLQESFGKPGTSRILRLRRWGWVAASIILTLAVGGYWWVAQKKNAGAGDIIQTTTAITPGRDGAILTLADGSRVSLDTIRNGIIALQGGTTAKVVNGALTYEGLGSEVVYNTMSTPKGRQYHLTLPDGSKVWLNAASSIRFPTVFSGTARRVEITGEAYFEVKKEGAPFIVNADDGTEVTVLGTHFNVNSYGNETSVNTTLLQGSVRISSAGQQLVIKPGEQARVDRNAQTISVVTGADLEKVMAWKNGMFNFEGTDLAEAMRQLERWYDIEVEYENGVPELRLVGKMTRGVTLNGLMVVLEDLGVHYRLAGRKLTILR